MIVRLIPVAAAAVMLTGCGDDLESRQSAVQGEMPEAGSVTMGEQGSPAAGTSPAQTAQDVDDAGDAGPEDEPVVADAGVEEFVDDAEGFSTDPIDDTSGFDPTPSDDGGFAPE